MKWGRKTKKNKVDNQKSVQKKDANKKSVVKKNKINRIEYLAKNYIGKKIDIPDKEEGFDEKRRVLYDEFITEKSFREILDMDPTKNKQYAEWILNIYSKGRFLMEDIGRLNEYLTLYNKCKHRLGEKQRNVKNFKDMEDLYQSILPYRNLSEEELMSKTELLKVKKMEGAELLLDNKRWRVISPLTQEAAILYGKGTRWCTASSQGYTNYFNTYTRDRYAGSKLFIIIDKTKTYQSDPENHKFQFHWESNQWHNADNRPVPGGVDKWLSDRPELLEMFTKLSTPFALKLRFKFNKNLTPEDRIINQDLKMSELQMKEIPSGLTVKGDCDFSGCEATTIHDLYVEGDLILENSSIKTITGSLIVKGSLRAKESSLESLPENTKIGGTACVQMSNLKELPKGLEVKSHVYASNTKITKLQEDMSIGGHLYLHSIKLENPDVKIKFLGGELKNNNLFIGMKS